MNAVREACSLQALVCALKHKDGVGDLQSGAQFDAHDLHNVGLSQQQEGLTVDHLERHVPQKSNSGDHTRIYLPTHVTFVCFNEMIKVF